MPIAITGDFDGGNPKGGDRVIRQDDDVYLIFPESEDGDPNYMFRLDVKVFNASSLPRTVSIIVDWQIEDFMELRDYVYLGDADSRNWTYVPGIVSGSRATFRLEAGPGETYICCHPKYDYEDYRTFVADVPETDSIRKRLLGRSAEGREIWGIDISDPACRPSRSVVAVARVHPYETSGSFCAEGILDAFRQPSARERDFLRRHALHVVPMICPDGVFHGFGKLTTRNGIDLSKKVDDRDESCRILKRLIDETKPSLYIEFHNWMFKELDGIYFMNAWQSRKFIRGMPSQEPYVKRWKPVLRRRLFSVPPLGFKKYCREKYHSVCACLEYPWFGRAIADMKALGIQTIHAMAEI